MRYKVLLTVLFLTIFSAGCSGLIPKQYVQNETISNGSLKAEVLHIFERTYVQIGHTTYYPPENHTLFAIFLQVTNNSKKSVTTDLTKAFIVEGKDVIGASMYLQGKKFAATLKKAPVRTLEAGEILERAVVYVLPKGQVPDMFVWKGVGRVKIPQTPIKYTSGK